MKAYDQSEEYGFCPSCGGNVAGHAGHCAICCTPLKTRRDAAQGTPVFVGVQSTYKPFARKEKKRFFMLPFLMVVFALMFLCVGGVRNDRYEEARLSGGTVRAIVTNVSASEDDDGDLWYEASVCYEWQGETYEVLLDDRTMEESRYVEGAELELVIDPEVPRHVLPDGEVALALGVMLLVGAGMLRGVRRLAKALKTRV